MNLELLLARKAKKQLDRAPYGDKIRITRILREMCENSFHGDVVKLKGADSSFRRRVGAYRILFDLAREENRLHVIAVHRRTTTTYTKK